MKFQETHWQIVSYLDISSLEDKLSFIDHAYNQTLHLCQSNQHSLMALCQSSLKLLKHIVPYLHKSEVDLKNLINNKRTKRAWLNIVGDALKTAFGTLDEADAKYYNGIINQINKNEYNLGKLLKQQIMVVNSTIANFNNTITDLNKNSKIFEENLIQISNYSRKINNRYLALELKQNLDEHFSLLNLVITTLQNEITTVMDTILLSRSNILHPYVITPFQLIEELSKTIPHLPSSSTYPLPVSRENAHKYLELLTIKCFFTDNRIGYVLSIPLVNRNQFNLYKLIPLPVLDNSTSYYKFILPSFNYLAISENHNLYLGLNELTNCQNLDESTFICVTSEPFYYTNSRPICETELLKSPLNIPINCNIRIITSRLEIWHKLDKPNTWIYILPKRTDIALNCFQMSHITLFLENTGILKINSNCKLYTSSATFLTDKTIRNSTHNAVVPQLKLNDDCCINLTKTKNFSLNLLPITPTNLHIDTLKEASHKLQDIAKSTDELLLNKDLTFFQDTSYTNHIFLLIFVIFIIFSLYSLSKYCKKRHSNHSIFNLCKKSSSAPSYNVKYDSSAGSHSESHSSAVDISPVAPNTSSSLPKLRTDKSYS